MELMENKILKISSVANNQVMCLYGSYIQVREWQNGKKEELWVARRADGGWILVNLVDRQKCLASASSTPGKDFATTETTENLFTQQWRINPYLPGDPVYSIQNISTGKFLRNEVTEVLYIKPPMLGMFDRDALQYHQMHWVITSVNPTEIDNESSKTTIY